MFIKLSLTFSPKKKNYLQENIFINSVFLQNNWGGKHGPITKFLKKYGKKYFSQHFVFGSILDHISALHAKIRVKSLLIKSDGFFVLYEGENAGKMGEMVKERAKCNIESKIDFTVPKKVTSPTPHGPNTKFLKKCLKNARKIRGKIIFPHFGF